MRTMAFLVAVLGLVAIGASCSSSSTTVDPCVAAGGACVPTTDTVECVALVNAACSTGLTCCTVGDGAPGFDAFVAGPPDSGPRAPDAVAVADGAVPPVADGASDASLDSPVDAVSEAALDARPKDAVDAHGDVASDAHDASTSPTDAGDATVHDGATDAPTGG